MAPPEVTISELETLPKPRTTQRRASSRKFTPAEVKRLVSESSRLLFIFENKVYDITKWAAYHPGGKLALNHAIGRDATDEVKALHPDFVLEKLLPKFCIGDFYQEPELEQNDWLKKQKQISLAYQELHRKVKESGLFKTRYSDYAWEALRCTMFGSVSLFLLRTFPESFFTVTIAALCLAFFWMQLSYTVHDLGHNSVTHQRSLDWVVGSCITSFLGGLSLDWWKDSHNIHHIITNHPEHDPDIQHLPFIAISKEFFDSIYSTYHGRILEFSFAAKWLVSMQHYTYYIIMSFGRFNLYAQSWIYLLRGRGVSAKLWWLQVVGMTVFWFWYLWLLSHAATWPLKLLFLWVTHAANALLHVQITLSHFGMCTQDLGPDEAFASRQLRTTMDIQCPVWLDWFHGGLQFQALHHLFPRAPRHRLREIQPLVRAFAKEQGLGYYEYTFPEGNIKVIRHLQHVAHQAGFLLQAAAASAVPDT